MSAHVSEIKSSWGEKLDAAVEEIKAEHEQALQAQAAAQGAAMRVLENDTVAAASERATEMRAVILSDTYLTLIFRILSRHSRVTNLTPI